MGIQLQDLHMKPSSAPQVRATESGIQELVEAERVSSFSWWHPYRFIKNISAGFVKMWLKTENNNNKTSNGLAA